MHQLLIGALLAVLLTRVPSIRRPRRSAAPAAVVGLGVLLVAFTSLGDSNAAYYAGLSAGVAAATALLIWGLEVAPQGFPARALGVAPVRWIGKISYGVYLWHWPVILAVGVPVAAFAWMPGRLALDASRVLFTFAIAGLSYRLVERPILEGTFPLIRASMKRSAVALVATTMVVGFAIVSLTRSPAQDDFVRGGLDIDRIGCELRICVRYEAPARDAPVVAIIGDSLARSLDRGFLSLAEREGWTYVAAASDGCRITHLLTSIEGDSAIYEPCFEATPSLWRDLVRTWQPDLVIALDSVELRDFVDAEGGVSTAGSTGNFAGELRELGVVADTFTDAGTRFVFVAVPPVVIPPECLRADSKDLDICAFPASDDPSVGPFNDVLEEVASRQSEAFMVSVTEHLCPAGICRPTIDGVFARYDGYHFTTAGAKWLVPILHTELLNAGALPPSML